MMNDHDVFWKLETLSDRQLLEGLGSVLGSSRRLMAELLAHLGEVEERRLHLAAACSSMFAYCVKLGMTEDEAYRRIEVARLARRYPAIFARLAAGQLTISAVALLKHHLSEENHVELLAAVAGKSVVQTRELLAARFPRLDVPSSVRKLPERRAVSQPSLATATRTEPTANVTESRVTEPTANVTESQVTEPTAGVTESRHSQRVTPPRVAPRLEPLSARRYKVQFTANAELARKLELARDLMRHAHPGGELGPIVERALDLLIERLMQRRFGKTKKVGPQQTSVCARRSAPEQRSDVMDDRPTMRGTAEAATRERATADLGTAEASSRERATPTLADGTTTHDIRTLGTCEPDAADTAAPTQLDTAAAQGDRRPESERASVSSYIPRSARRTVVERDGLSCSWVDEQGARCGSRAWLEYDHRHPRAKGGGSEPDNLRLLCRHHNRFAAEREYGRRHVEQTIAEQRGERAPHAI